MKRAFLLLYILTITIVGFGADKASRTVVYDENHGMNLWHITKMLQDARGFIWISSWEGLTRFDGYDFVTFKSKAGDGSPLTSNRMRDIVLKNNDDIYCLVDERWFLFSQKQGTFHPVSDKENKLLAMQKARHTLEVSKKKKVKTSSRRITDRQGNLWQVVGDSVMKTVFVQCPARKWNLRESSQVRCFYMDTESRCWLTTKEDKLVCLYDKSGRGLGYLSPSGALASSPIAFSSSVYAILQSKTGAFYLGTKPGGLYVLRRQGKGFEVKHISLGSQNANSIYDVKEDRQGRIWLATFDGIYCLEGEKVEPVNQTRDWRVRNLHIAEGGILMAATTTGLAIGKIPDKSVGSMRLTVHTREANRANSLSNSATMDILETPEHAFYISTESGGVNKIQNSNLLDKQLVFTHYDKNAGLGTESIVALAPYRDGWLWVVGGNDLMMLNTKTGEVRNYDKGFFQESHAYSDAHPVKLPDGRWLFGLLHGAFTVTEQDLSSRKIAPDMVFTGISVEHAPMQYAVSHLKEIVLNSNQRHLQVSFSALDYSQSEDIRYAFRLHGEDEWTYIGKEHTLTLPDMKPGDYELQVRCTHSAGTWTTNPKSLHIHVTPKFTETVWARLLEILLALVVALGGTYVYLYIRAIKCKQRETLEAYLALLESREKQERGDIPEEDEKEGRQVITDKEDDLMMKRLMDFINSHLADSGIGIVEMAEAAALSRSGLNRKMKKIVGLTPAEFLKETRIKHARHLLADTSLGVSEIAYACGFTDPKYFGKTFKAMVGVSPSDFRQKSGNP